jgi:hypothetical protein
MPRPIFLDKVIDEESTGTFKITFRDTTGALVTPTAVNWDLTALDGTVIAYNQSETPANPQYITISGSNTRILQGEESFGQRLLTVRAVYNSDRGNNLPNNKQYRFKVRNLKRVGYPLSIEVIDLAFVVDQNESVSVN